MIKQKTYKGDEKADVQSSDVAEDLAMTESANKGKAMLDKLAAAQQKTEQKKGHYEYSCCGRRWVED